MNSKKVLILLLLSLCFQKAPAQHADTASRTSNTRLYLVVGSSAIFLTGTYFYLQSVWWKDTPSEFKIDHDMDYKYAKNLDKAGHFFGGMMTAELYGFGYEWAGCNRSKALLFAGITGTAIQAFVEFKDAYAPTYGFSVGDLVAGSAGSFFPLLQYKVPFFNALQVKASYYKHHDYYYNQFPHAQLIDDYMNQTYWVSVSVNDWLPKASNAEKLWPDFLTIAFGWGVDETLNWYYKGVNISENKGKGNYEYYASIDVDWRKIIKPNTTFKRALTTTLNLFKLPLPTLRFAPSVKVYPVYL